MKEEIKEYLKSKTEINKQEFHMRESIFKVNNLLIIIGLCIFAFAMYKALF